jgi:hypothetical protein
MYDVKLQSENDIELNWKIQINRFWIDYSFFKDFQSLEEI